MSAMGETDLAKLLKNMQPSLHASPFVFCSVKPGERFEAADRAWATVQEPEGTTYVLPREAAVLAKAATPVSWALITLTVHSSLSAIGFLARICQTLAAEQISVNPISGFFHDHLLVPWDDRFTAMEALRKLSEGIGSGRRQ